MSAIIEAAKRFAKLDGDICSLLVGVDGRVSCQSCDLRKQTLWHESDADLLEDINSLLPEGQRVTEDVDSDAETLRIVREEASAFCHAQYIGVAPDGRLYHCFGVAADALNAKILELQAELQGKDDAIAELESELREEKLLNGELRNKLAAKDDLASALVEAAKARTCAGVVLAVFGDAPWNLDSRLGNRVTSGDDIHTAASAIRTHLSRVTLEQAQAAVASGDKDTVRRWLEQEGGKC